MASLMVSRTPMAEKGAVHAAPSACDRQSREATWYGTQEARGTKEEFCDSRCMRMFCIVFPPVAAFPPVCTP